MAGGGKSSGAFANANRAGGPTDPNPQAVSATGAHPLREVDLFGEPIINGHKSVLARTFEYPPFSVLNAREGWWQDRKRQWLALGIKSEVGRVGGEHEAIPGGAGKNSVMRGLNCQVRGASK